MEHSLRTWAIGGALVITAACSGGGEDNREYLQQTRDEFLQACEADGGSEADCTRRLECVEQELTFEDYVQLALDKAGGADTPRLDDALDRCAGA